MEPIITNLPKSLVEIKFTITPLEVQPYLDQAAADLQIDKPIPGFRPGKAPYDVVNQAVGEMRIWEAALERVVRARYVQTILEKQIEALGSPSISVEQLVPGQEIKFTVTVPVMPAVITLANYDAPLVTKKIHPTTEVEVRAALDELRKMRRQEAVVDRPAGKDDLVIVDLEMKKDKVVVEGGTAKNFRVYLNEPQYIPDFAEQLVGLKKGDEKTFALAMPKEHYQKHLAGQTLDFTVKVLDVFELKLPELNDAFAQGLGFDALEKLQAQLKLNLEHEAQHKADEAAEIELIEKLLKASRFGDVPETLISQEVHRMFHELEHAAESQGMKMEDYLASLKKTADQIKLDLVPRAIERVQAAVLIKEIAKKEGTTVPDAELDVEQDRILTAAKDNQELKERIASPEYRDYLASQMKNRKTLELLKSKAIQEG
jgi:trigger factor